MWWRKPLLTLALPLALAGCGFHPLYGKQGVDPNVAEELASVQVDPLRDRQGQLIHNALIKALTPDGTPAKPRYHLMVAYTITEAQQALQTDATATRDVLYYKVLYRLYEGSSAVTAGTFPKTFSYNFLAEHFANIAAQTDVQQRAAEAICEEVRNRLAIYFSTAAGQRAALAQ
jgi:LPS-assembly lipoprotein